MSRNPFVPKSTALVQRILETLTQCHPLDTIEHMASTRSIEALRPAVVRAYSAVAETSLRLFHDALSEVASQVHSALAVDSTTPRALDGQHQARSAIVAMLVGNQMQVLGDVMDASRSAAPRVAAVRLRNALGLTGPLVNSVLAYERVLRQPERRGDDISAGQLDTMTGMQARNLRGQRAGVLGLGEAQRAWGRALCEAWTQGVERGLVHGVTRRWVAGKDSRDSHVAMHGVVRPLRQPFESGRGNMLMYPGDGAAPAVDAVGCDCHLEYTSV